MIGTSFVDCHTNSSNCFVDKGKYVCDNGIMLEPRIQQYIQKKKYYKKNKIEPSVAPEIEYQITDMDKMRIREYMKGNKNMYSIEAQERYTPELVVKGFEFDPDEAYKSDPRYKNYQKKVSKTMNALEQRYKYDGMNNQYEIKHQSHSRTYNDPPQVQRNVRQYPMHDGFYNSNACNDPTNHNPNNNAVVNKLETYAQKLNKINSNGVVLGQNNISRKNVDLENEILRNTFTSDPSLPIRGGKRHGYRDNAEHFFDYIDDDLQKPEHVVSDRGVSTRLNNHKTYNETLKSRDIY